MLVGDRAKYVTLEDVWNNNKQNESCIPTGTYTAKKRLSFRFHRELWELINVQDRNNILIHNGNFDEDTLGCILIGKGIGENSITNSKDALEAFMLETKDDELLEIKIVDAIV